MAILFSGAEPFGEFQYIAPQGTFREIILNFNQQFKTEDVVQRFFYFYGALALLIVGIMTLTLL